MIVILASQTDENRELIDSFKKLGVQVEVSLDPEILNQGNAFIIPNYASIAGGMRELSKPGMTQVLKNILEKELPILAVGNGMHLLFEGVNDEGFTSCLGILDGISQIFPKEEGETSTNEGLQKHVTIEKNWLTESVHEKEMYYHHDYFVDSDLEVITGLGSYALKFPAIIQASEVIGVQFLPEKSGKNGEKLFSAFIRYVSEKEVKTDGISD